jgi:hypothetical protein
MTYLVAAIEHHARKLANAVTRAVAVKLSGYKDYEAGDYFDADKLLLRPADRSTMKTVRVPVLLKFWPNETSAATPPAAVDDPAGGAPASAPLPSAGSPSVPAGVSARTPDIAAPSAGLDPVGTIRTLPSAVAVRIIDGAWSVIWHQWGADTDISEQSWVYRDGSPMAARIAANWPILVRGPAVPLAGACLAVGVSVASEFFPQHQSRNT